MQYDISIVENFTCRAVVYLELFSHMHDILFLFHSMHVLLSTTEYQRFQYLRHS